MLLLDRNVPLLVRTPFHLAGLWSSGFYSTRAEVAVQQGCGCLCWAQVGTFGTHREGPSSADSTRGHRSEEGLQELGCSAPGCSGAEGSSAVLLLLQLSRGVFLLGSAAQCCSDPVVHSSLLPACADSDVCATLS